MFFRGLGGVEVEVVEIVEGDAEIERMHMWKRSTEVGGFTVVDEIAAVNGGAEVKWGAMVKGMKTRRQLQ